MHDYLWRWDTDWFWCSRAFGAQHPVVRRLWPRRLRRSDVYWRLVALDRRFGIGGPARPPRGPAAGASAWCRTSRCRSTGSPEFLAWFDAEVGHAPGVAVPAAAARGPMPSDPWPTYPLTLGDDLRQRRASGATSRWGPRHRTPRATARSRRRSTSWAATSRLYSEAFYERADFDRLYDGANLAAVRAAHDPDGRMTDLFDKVVGGR